MLRRLGRRALALADELGEVERQLEAVVQALAPELLSECGVGPICAAQLIVSSGDPRRMRSEASFAALAGTSPVEASSGPRKRHRLNRGGDRQLNSALHLIALSRTRFHPETAAYHGRLLQGRASARRCAASSECSRATSSTPCALNPTSPSDHDDAALTPEKRPGERPTALREFRAPRRGSWGNQGFPHAPRGRASARSRPSAARR